MCTVEMIGGSNLRQRTPQAPLRRAGSEADPHAQEAMGARSVDFGHHGVVLKG